MTTGNTALTRAMRKFGLSQRELAERINDEIAVFAGRRGTVSEGTVGRWVTGRSAWPQGRQRKALEAVFGCPASALGFVPRSRGTTRKAQADPVHRRTFVLAAAAVPVAPSGRRTLGSGDVERLAADLPHLTAADDRHGGTLDIEARALDRTRHILDLLQKGSASERIRGQLYGVAAAYGSTAMWAAVDGRRIERAHQLWERVLPLAGLSGDPGGQWRVWSHASMLAHQRGRPTDALAAADASRACGITRRDPLYRSLSFARQGLAHAANGERATTLRLLDHARTALDRADPHAGRPAWIGFYDAAELAGLGCVMHLDIGAPAEAEADAHRALALLRPSLTRNRSYYTVHLARAQLAQGDLDQATATAARVTDEGAPSGRTREFLTRFGRELATLAPDARQTRDWITRQRDTRQE